MKKVILSLAILTGLSIAGALELYKQVPQPIGTAVIAERVEGQVGGVVATVVPENLTNRQHTLMNLAYEVAKKNGFKNPELVQAVLLQETGAGTGKYKVANPGPDAYFGPMQIKLAATKDVLARHPNLWNEYAFHTRTDDEIKANLILNERFNLDVATKYLMLLKTTYGFSGRDLLNAYNRGPGGVKFVDQNFHYAVGAEQKLASYKAR